MDVELEELDGRGLLRTMHRDDAGRVVVTMLVGIANWYDLDGCQSPRDIAVRDVEFASELVGLIAHQDASEQRWIPGVAVTIKRWRTAATSGVPRHGICC